VTRLRCCSGCMHAFPPAELTRGRCRSCLVVQQKVRDKRRGTTTERGYGNQWRKLRAKLLVAHPYCAWCGSTEKLSIDHIVPRAAGGTDDPSNLRVLCFRCNTRRRRGWEGGGDASKRLPEMTTPPEIREKNVRTGDDPGWSVAQMPFPYTKQSWPDGVPPPQLR
jgi:5-methylcytosine-specific restriction protein A